MCAVRVRRDGQCCSGAVTADKLASRTCCCRAGRGGLPLVPTRVPPSEWQSCAACRQVSKTWECVGALEQPNEQQHHGAHLTWRSVGGEGGLPLPRSGCQQLGVYFCLSPHSPGDKQDPWWGAEKSEVRWLPSSGTCLNSPGPCCSPSCPTVAVAHSRVVLCAPRGTAG